MKNTKEKKTKEKNPKFQIISSVLILTIILFAELYLMINLSEKYIPIVILGIAALVDVFIMINAYMTFHEMKEAKRNEHFENLYKSEKACYNNPTKTIFGGNRYGLYRSHQKNQKRTEDHQRYAFGYDGHPAWHAQQDPGGYQRFAQAFEYSFDL